METTLLVAVLVLLASTAVADYTHPDKPTPPKRTTDIVVEGMVYCQNCKYSGAWNLDEAEPIKSAKVSVICKNYKHHVSFYKVLETNPDGYFYGELKGYSIDHSILDHPLHACHVKLVSSPLKHCNLLSNINYGMYGAPLRYEDKRTIGDHDQYEAIIYSAGPLAFRPSNCAPETNA